MKSALLASRQSLRIEERPSLAPKRGEALVQVLVCGVCRTDRKAFHIGQIDLRMPRILGHEIVGRIVEIAEGSGYMPGDLVAVFPGSFCGHCEACLAGMDNMCEEMEILGFHLDGGFSEYLIVPSRIVSAGGLVRIEEGCELSFAALSEPLACAIRQRTLMGSPKGSSLLVIGGGALGILTAKLWELEGASRVCIVEKDPEKRAVAISQGLPAASEPQGAFDDCVVCAPGGDAYELGIHALKKGGRLGFFSALTALEGLDIQTINAVHYKCLSVIGSYGCSLADFQSACEILGAGKLSFEQSLFRHISLENLPESLSLETQAIFTQLIFGGK